MESLSRNQALNILRSNKWIGNATFLDSEDNSWQIFFDEIFSHGELCFSYKDVFVGFFKFKQIGFIFKKFDPADELYIAYLAVLEEIAEEDAKRRENRKSKALKEIRKTYTE